MVTVRYKILLIEIYFLNFWKKTPSIVVPYFVVLSGGLFDIVKFNVGADCRVDSISVEFARTLHDPA